MDSLIQSMKDNYSQKAIRGKYDYSCNLRFKMHLMMVILSRSGVGSWGSYNNFVGSWSWMYWMSRPFNYCVESIVVISSIVDSPQGTIGFSHSVGTLYNISITDFVLTLVVSAKKINRGCGQIWVDLSQQNWGTFGSKSFKQMLKTQNSSIELLKIKMNEFHPVPLKRSSVDPNRQRTRGAARKDFLPIKNLKGVMDSKRPSLLRMLQDFQIHNIISVQEDLKNYNMASHKHQ
ncbi:hypothetical protein HUJ05_003764 [Dendroctonus ponderosae]|nr:hypothetical protein HUJ05_003764 [Dendroctonus ponderosae]